MTEPDIVCEGLVRIFAVADIEVQALQGLDLVIGRGELVALVGASGSGKSTLLSILSALDAPTAGKATVAQPGATPGPDHRFFRFRFQRNPRRLPLRPQSDRNRQPRNLEFGGWKSASQQHAAVPHPSVHHRYPRHLPAAQLTGLNMEQILNRRQVLIGATPTWCSATSTPAAWRAAWRSPSPPRRTRSAAPWPSPSGSRWPMRPERCTTSPTRRWPPPSGSSPSSAGSIPGTSCSSGSAVPGPCTSPGWPRRSGSTPSPCRGPPAWPRRSGSSAPTSASTVCAPASSPPSPGNASQVEELFAELEAACRAELEVEGATTVARSVDARYRGQAHQITIPVTEQPLAEGDVPGLVARFHEHHRHTYGVDLAAPVELVNFRVRLVRVVDKPPAPADAADDRAPGRRRPRPSTRRGRSWTRGRCTSPSAAATSRHRCTPGSGCRSARSWPDRAWSTAATPRW